MVLNIGSMGLVTPVGLSLHATCAALRAGISRLGELPVENPLPEPVIGAYVKTGLPVGLQRLTRLLTTALRECLHHCEREQFDEVPLLVCVADAERPDAVPANDEFLIERTSHRLRRRFHPHFSRVIPGGRSSVFQALADARTLIADGKAECCIVAGVDSLLSASCRGWLYQKRRLKLQGNPDGLHPGEAAGAVEVMGSGKSTRSSRPRLELTGLGFGFEKNTVFGTEPNLADGLVDAVKMALQEAHCDMSEVDFRISDVTGEQYYFRETVNAMARILRIRKSAFPIWHAADAIGDVGAAVGAVQLCMAAVAFDKGYAPGKMALCQTSSDFGQRAAVVVKSVEKR